MIKLKNRIYFIFVLALFTCQCNGASKPKTNNVEKTNQVIVLTNDTIITDSIASYCICLKIANKEIKIENRFLFDINDTTSIFDLRKYRGMYVSYKKSIIDEYISFNSTLCENASWEVFSVFKGDSIDNPEGYSYKYIAGSNAEYYVLSGYFLGCNGSFCNSGTVLVLSFANDELNKVALFGIDRTMIDFNSFSPEIINDSLFLDFETEVSGKKKELKLYFDNEINLIPAGDLIENGLSCIK